MNTLFKTVTSSLPARENDQNIVSFDHDSATTQTLFIQDLELEMSIGVLENEKQAKQKVFVSAELVVEPNQDWRADDIKNVVSYADIVEQIKEIAAEGHINLVETFAEKIIERCFDNSQIQEISITVEKPDVIKEVKTVGVNITKSRV